MQVEQPKVITRNEKSLKRLAMHFVGQLPDNEDEARRVLFYMGRLIERFFVDNRPDKPNLAIVSDGKPSVVALRKKEPATFG